MSISGSIPLGKIKIRTGQMKNMSWVTLLGHRRDLKMAVAAVAQADSRLQDVWRRNGRLEVTRLLTRLERKDSPTGLETSTADGKTVPIVSRDEFLAITGFGTGDIDLPLPSPIMISITTDCWQSADLNP